MNLETLEGATTAPTIAMRPEPIPPPTFSTVLPPTRRADRHRGKLLLVALMVAGPAVAQESPGELHAEAMTRPRTPAAEVSAAAADSYRIMAGDELSVKFFYVPEMDQKVMVRPDGKLNLPLIGAVDATELTPEQLAQRLREAYADELRYPEVSVSVEKGFASQQVFVGGEVGHPGVQALTPQLTLMRAVIAAQGTKASAASRRVLILRKQPGGGQQVIQVDLAAQMRGKGGEDPLLRPYDVVLVPPSRISKVNDWVDLYIRKNLPIDFSYFVGPRQ